MSKIPQELVIGPDGVTLEDDLEEAALQQDGNYDEENRIMELPDPCRPVS